LQKKSRNTFCWWNVQSGGDSVVQRKQNVYFVRFSTFGKEVKLEESKFTLSRLRKKHICFFGSRSLHGFSSASLAKGCQKHLCLISVHIQLGPQFDVCSFRPFPFTTPVEHARKKNYAARCRMGGPRAPRSCNKLFAEIYETIKHRSLSLSSGASSCGSLLRFSRCRH
jgi:hypothetical protein